MVSKTQIVLEKLQALYDRALQADRPKIFFLSLIEYVEVFDTNPLLEPAMQALITQGEIDMEPLNKLEEKSYKEMRDVYKQVKSYVDTNKIEIQPVTKNLVEFQQSEDGTYWSSLGTLRTRHGCLSYALMCLVEDQKNDHLSFTRKFGSINDEKRIQEWHFSPSYNEWEEKRKHLDRLQETKAWHSWELLVLPYNLYKHYEKLQENSLKKNKVWEMHSLIGLFNELRDVIEEKSQRAIIEFKVDDYRLYLQRVHLYTREALLVAEQETQNQTGKHNWTYDTASGVLHLDGKIIQLKKNNFRAKVLELLSKNDKNKNKTWSWDEVYEAIENSDDQSKQAKRSIYEACKGISEHIASKSGITDFLIYDTLTVRINPSYLA